jgi:hypothetical protein
MFISTLFFNLGARWGWVLNATTRPLPPGKTQYPFYRRLGGPQGLSGRVHKISPPPPPEFDPRTLQPVASHSADCADIIFITIIIQLLHINQLLTSSYGMMSCRLIPVFTCYATVEVLYFPHVCHTLGGASCSFR